MLKEIRTRGDIVLFIDEIHTLVGAGAAEGAIDAASILKPMLARGELQTVGATTIDEYRKHLEKDAALERRFQPVKVDQPTVALTIDILKGLRDRYESHHAVSITDQALVAAANLADRYLADRFLPDKAIDLIDEAGSRLRIRRMTSHAQRQEAGRGDHAPAGRQGSRHREGCLRAGQEVGRAGEGAPGPQGVPGVRAARRGRRPVRRGRRRGDRRGAGGLDRHSGLPAHRGGDLQAPAHGRRAAQAGHRPGRGAQGAVAGHPPHPCRAQGPQAPERFVHLLGPDRRRKDRTGQDPGRVPLRRRGRADPARHERVHGEAHGQPAGGFASGLRRATKRVVS